MLCFNEATKILERFNVKDKVLKIKSIQETEKLDNYRGIFLITTSNTELVCRISNEQNYPMTLVEKQSQFAMLLHSNGIDTAKKYVSQGNYCIQHWINGMRMQITLEEYIGEDISDIDICILKDFGEILGKIHSVSLEHPFVIGKSFVSEYVRNDKARFSQILAKADPPIPDLPCLHIVGQLHDELVKELSKIWYLLPTGAVHGDLGAFNNLINTVRGIGIIDYNLAGDEAYLGDVLSSYYASIHKYLWKDIFSGSDESSTFLMFWNGYSKFYSASEMEIAYFPQISALFDGLFYCKSAIDVWNQGFHEDALIMIQASVTHFDPSAHPFPQVIHEEGS